MEWMQVAACLVSVLSELHEGQIIFRGISPDILLLDYKGNVLAMDYRLVLPRIGCDWLAG